MELRRITCPGQGNFWRYVGEDVKRSDMLGCLNRSIRTCRGEKGAGQGWGGCELHEPTHFIGTH